MLSSIVYTHSPFENLGHTQSWSQKFYRAWTKIIESRIFVCVRVKNIEFAQNYYFLSGLIDYWVRRNIKKYELSSDE